MSKLLRARCTFGFVLAVLLAAGVGALRISAAHIPENTTYQALPFSQDWTNTGLITADDDWSGVPGVMGYRGDGLTGGIDTDPQTILADGTSTPVDVNANRTDPNTFTTGGVAEFHITNPVVALQGSGTADAPFILIYLNTTGYRDIRVRYNLRDIDGSTDNAVQQIALHYRVGSSGNFTNVPAAYVPDATTGPNQATLVTPIDVTLPSAADNQAQLQIRVMTTNATGSDEWVGVDDIVVSGTAIGEVAPAVASTTPAAGAKGVAVNANVVVNFTEPVNVSGTWFTIQCSGSGAHPAVVSGGPTSFTLNPNTDFVNCEQCTVTILAGQVTDQDLNDPPDNMAADYVFDFMTACACSTIPQVQGVGAAASPCEGQTVTLSGCVIGVTAAGFYMQATPGDGDPASSDGIYVYMYASWTNPEGIQVGRLATATSGEVQEYYEATELYHPASVSRGSVCVLPTPVAVQQIQTLGPHDATRYETTEFMRVQMTIDGHVQGPTKRFESRFANGDPEIGFIYWGVVGSLPHAPRLFQEDYEGYGGLNYLSGACNKDLPDVDFGDRLQATDLVGVMGYHFDKWQLVLDESQVQNMQVTNNPDIADSEAPFAADEFGLCSFNVENMFDYVDDGDGDVGDWNPADAAEYNRMLEKRAKGIALDLQKCTVIGVQEMEGKDQVWDDLEAWIESVGGAGTNFEWHYYESQDPRDITQGILYDANRVTLVSSSQRQGCTTTNYGVDYGNARGSRVVPNPCSGGTYPLFTRPPYVARLQVAGGPDFTIIVNHFKSKGSNTGCTTPDCTDWREKQAQFMQTLVNDYWSTTQNQAIVGDLNDYIASPPIAVLDNTTTPDGQRLVNVMTAHVPKSDQYTYIYSGESEVLDYIYLSKVFEVYLQAASPMHIDADFPDVAPMDSDNCPGGNCPFGLRPEDDTSRHSSDHDPVFARMSIAPTAVRLVAFAARPAAGGIALLWETASEDGNAGFDLYRSTRPGIQGAALNDTLIPSRAPGGGRGATYAFLDAAAEPGVAYYYTLEDVDVAGRRTPHGPVAVVGWWVYVPLAQR